jgi:hypothetical protein
MLSSTSYRTTLPTVPCILGPFMVHHIAFSAFLPPFAFLSPFIHHFYLLIVHNMFISSLHSIKSKKIQKNK